MAGRKRKPRKEQAPGWVWMLFGLSVGLAVALFVYLQRSEPVAPLVEPPRLAAPTPTPEPRQQPEAQTEPEPEPVAEAEPEQTELEFYELLRTLEVAVPEGRQPAANQPRPTQLASEYTIQAGAFSSYESADSLRARLTLLAIDAHIQRTIVNNNVLYQVIIGPLNDIDEMDRILRRLASEEIETLPPRPVSN